MTMRPDIDELETERIEAYLAAGYRKWKYRYPLGAFISVEWKGQFVNLIFPYVSSQLYDAVWDRIDKLKEDYPGAIISITIPSRANIKANHQ
jgi:hypothetical protein